MIFPRRPKALKRPKKPRAKKPKVGHHLHRGGSGGHHLVR
jgi:hypothetical protein